jgi:predicted glycoside hydrolase/deacetylase ChbG (UPF0249 family)
MDGSHLLTERKTCQARIAPGRAPVRLIINADDLGRSPEVNEAVAELLARGLITSATVMANAPGLTDALRRIPPCRRHLLGLHLNITEFSPLTLSPAWRGWLEPEGCFSLTAFRKVTLTREKKEAVFQEWLAQAARLRALGLPLSHLDSHHDVHTVTRLFVVLKRLQGLTGIRRVRLAANLAAGPRPRFRRNRLWNLALRHWPPATLTTDGFMEFGDFLQRVQNNLPVYPVMELMVHPGHPGFAAEFARLTGPWRQTLPFPVQLLSYPELS